MTDDYVDLANPTLFSYPFPYFYSMGILEQHMALQVLTWLEQPHSFWKLVETDFYEQFEFNLEDIAPPTHLSFLRNRSFAAELCRQMTSIFNEQFTDRMDVVAHKLVPGQRIGIHNDRFDGLETHRLVIQLNSGWAVSDGGYFMTFEGPDVETVYQIVSPIHNTGIGFAISSRSYHAVSTVYSRPRYSLVCSLYAERDA